MKSFSIILLNLLLLLPTQLFGKQYSGQVSFLGRELVVFNDSVDIQFAAFIQKKAVRDAQVMILSPELSGNRESLLLPFIRIQGNNRRQMETRAARIRSPHEWSATPYRTYQVHADKDTVIYYHIRIAHEPWMNDVKLVIHKEMNDGGNRIRLFSFTMDANIHLNLPEPYAVKPVYAWTEPLPEVKKRSKQAHSFLDFKVNSTVLLPNFRLNREKLFKIENDVCLLSDSKDIEVNRLHIDGYASPEGRFASNGRLAEGRAQALRNYIVANNCLPRTKIATTNGGEDWNGFLELLEASNLAQKEQIIEIIKQTRDSEQRKVRMRSLIGEKAYQHILTTMYPLLRRVVYTVEYTIKDYSVSEAKALLGKNEELLSHREFYQVAMSYGRESKEWNTIVGERIVKYFDQDPVALSNAAAVLAQRGETATAKRYLEKAGNLPQACNNLGALLMLEGNYEAARKLFIKAQNAGLKAAEENLQELNKKIKDEQQRNKYEKKQPEATKN